VEGLDLGFSPAVRIHTDRQGSQSNARRAQIRIVSIGCQWILTPRREAANQTQWFDGIIRTVGSSSNHTDKV